MNAECLQLFQPAFDSLFSRWTALKLAVEHSDDTRKSLQTAIEIKNWLFDYCTQNDDIHESEIRQNLEDIMDQEFDAICEDNSINELSEQIVGYLKLCIAGRFEEVQQRLAQLPHCVNWLVPGFQVTKAPRDDSDSASDDDSDDEDMDTDSETAPTLVEPNRRQRNEPQVDEDGFTMIVGRRR